MKIIVRGPNEIRDHFSYSRCFGMKIYHDFNILSCFLNEKKKLFNHSMYHKILFPTCSLMFGRFADFSVLLIMIFVSNFRLFLEVDGFYFLKESIRTSKKSFKGQMCEASTYLDLIFICWYR